VEVGADGDSELDDAGYDAPDLTRHGDADRVGEQDLVRSGDGEQLRELDDATLVDGALEGTAERDADVQRRADPVCSGALRDTTGRAERLLDRGVLVRPVEGLCGPEGEADLVEAGGREALVSALVEREPAYTTPSLRWSELTTSSAPAICGTRRGSTKLATSTARSPAATRRPTRSARISGGRTSGSFCRPSLGPTS
jgi:hypothetical protein